MRLKEKIIEQIKEKELQLKNLDKIETEIKIEEEKAIDEDCKLINIINPFYKRKFKMYFPLNPFVRASINSEIELLKNLLRK